jgi:hypothetical protein
VTVAITPASDLRSKDRMNGNYYQACNDQYCLRPVVQDFSLARQSTQELELPHPTRNGRCNSDSHPADVASRKPVS